MTQDACNPGKGRQGLEWEDQMVRCWLLLVCSPLSGGLSSAYYISQIKKKKNKQQKEKLKIVIHGLIMRLNHCQGNN